MVESKITKWGNSLAIRIPHTIASQFGIKEFSSVYIEYSNDCLVIKRKRSLDYMLALISNENMQPLVDFGEPQGKELI